jgi:hypothetical protein
MLNVAETKTHSIAKQVGPFTAAIRPFTIHAAGTGGYVKVPVPRV